MLLMAPRQSDIVPSLCAVAWRRRVMSAAIRRLFVRSYVCMRLWLLNVCTAGFEEVFGRTRAKRTTAFSSAYQGDTQSPLKHGCLLEFMSLETIAHLRCTHCRIVSKRHPIFRHPGQCCIVFGLCHSRVSRYVVAMSRESQGYFTTLVSAPAHDTNV